jgi:hypothetical protein|tara:strand:+ start:1662 stop:1832 length:171 start_codon:yes stop_codon:yes gene_type:complete
MTYEEFINAFQEEIYEELLEAQIPYGNDFDEFLEKTIEERYVQYCKDNNIEVRILD